MLAHLYPAQRLIEVVVSVLVLHRETRSVVTNYETEKRNAKRAPLI